MAGHDHLIRNPRGFGFGYTPVTRIGEPEADTGMSFGFLKLRAGEAHEAKSPLESAYLLLDGEVAFAFDGGETTRSRASPFDDDPTCLHLAGGAKASLTARRDSELAVVETANDSAFPSRLFDAGSLLEREHRGRGLLGDTAYRVVRTVFDLRNRPEARLVLGEVVNLPGRWSSYPPHHHTQPEIYHYRFTSPHGYGHAELGEDVLRVRQYDTVKILGGRDHAQVAAPGYGMYYVWTIRHLPDRPYRGFEYAEEHRWLQDPAAQVWKPRV